MKKIILVILATLSGYFTYGQIKETDCVSCSDNYINFTNFASGIGTDNRATGNRSFVGGMGSNAKGNYSIAFGYRAYAGGTNAISLGFTSNATGMYSVAIGRQSYANGPAAFALGLASNAQAESSYVFGEFLKATASGTVTIGHGAGTGENYLLNEIPNSLMMGINSNLSTFFISESDGYGTTGRIGIGNVTDPQAKLHIKADNDEDAAIKLEATGNGKQAKIVFGEENRLIYSKTGEPLTFKSDNTNGFFFENGNVGIGTDDPVAKVQIKDGDIFIEDINRGIVMKSPDGSCWRGTLDNSGALHFVQVNCDEIQTGTTSPEAETNYRVKVYPNPADRYIKVEVSGDRADLDVQLTDMNGRLLFAGKLRSHETTINTQQFRPGDYVLKITTPCGKTVLSEKIIIL